MTDRPPSPTGSPRGATDIPRRPYERRPPDPVPGRRRRGRALALLHTVVLGAVAACGGGPGTAVGSDDPSTADLPARQPRCVAVLDVDSSTRDVEGLAEQYELWLHAFVTRCGHQRAYVNVVFATSNSLTDAVPPVEALLAGTDDEVAQVVNAVVAHVRSTSSDVTSTGDGTDILGALAVAGRRFASSPPDGRRLLVLSDGVNTHRPINLTTAALDDAGIDSLLGEAADDDLLVALDDVAVEMVGVGTGVDADLLGSDRLAGIGAFWAAYFSQAGAELVCYNKTPC